MAKIAVITGSNKGISFAIVRELLKRNIDTVYLTSRDINRGQVAVEKLKKEGLLPAFHQLDITNEDSVKKFAEYIKEKHGCIDILINNAGVVVNNQNKVIYEDVKHVIDVNYRSMFIVQEHLYPVLNENARVINISSDYGHLSNIRNKYWIERLSKKNLQVEDIDAFVEWFLDSVKNETMKEEDFADSFILGYRISKVALCALTIIQQNEIGRNISIVSLHPGFVKTDMTNNIGYMTAEESAATPVYLALDAPQTLKGAFIWYDKKNVDWYDTKLSLW